MADFFDPTNTGFGADNVRYNPNNTGYGASPKPVTPPGVMTLDEVAQNMRNRPTAASLTGGGGVAPPTAVTGAQVPFYNRPIAVPSWLKSVGSFVKGGFGLAGTAAGVYQAADFLKNTAEPAVVDAMSGPSILGPAGVQYKNGGGTNVASPSVQPGDGYGVGMQNEPHTALPIDAAAPAGYGTTQAAAPVVAPQRLINGQPYQPVTRTVGADGQIQITGSGAPEGYGINPPPGARTPVGGFVGAALGLKNIAGDNARRDATLKLLLDQTGKQATAQKDLAAAGVSAGALALARAHLATNPGDLSTASAILHGRVQPGGSFSEVTNVIPKPGGAVTVLDKRSGSVSERQPQRSTPVAKGTDGKFYLLGPDGKAQREATADEQKRYAAGK